MLSNTATPRYYGEFREKVLRGLIPVNEEISMEMNRIDDLVKNPNVYYDDEAVEGWIRFCENELTLTDGSPLYLLDSFKIWGEQVFGWYFFDEESTFEPYEDRPGGRWVNKLVIKRLTTKQYLIVARGAAKSMYGEAIQSYFLTVDSTAKEQITTAPTMRQAEEVMSPFRTAITRARGPWFKFLTEGSLQNTTGSRANRQKLCSTKKGIQNFLTSSILEVRPMSIDKLQGSRCRIATIDEWLSGDIREDVVGCVEQGASKNDDYLIVAMSSEGTVRNSVGDEIKMELLNILKGKFSAPRTSIWYYRLDDVKEVADRAMWIKANPNLGKTIKWSVYIEDVERMENAPATKNDILAKRFGIPTEGYTYFFTYKQTLPHPHKDFWRLPCSMGVDLSQGDDFCAFTFLFPLSDEFFGVKARSYISERTYVRLPNAARNKYDEFIKERSLIIMPGTTLNMEDVYDDLIRYIEEIAQYDVICVGYDPYNAKEFINRWQLEHGEFGVEKVIQGAKTESVPLGEIRDLAEDRKLLFDEEIMTYCMGNCIVAEDTNGNRKLLKRRYEHKIDNVSALMDAWVSYKLMREAFE